MSYVAFWKLFFCVFVYVSVYVDIPNAITDIIGHSYFAVYYRDTDTRGNFKISSRAQIG